jgi:hypothetical protein
MTEPYVNPLAKREPDLPRGYQAFTPEETEEARQRHLQHLIRFAKNRAEKDVA